MGTRRQLRPYGFAAALRCGLAHRRITRAASIAYACACGWRAARNLAQRVLAPVDGRLTTRGIAAARHEPFHRTLPTVVRLDLFAVIAPHCGIQRERNRPIDRKNRRIRCVTG